MKLQDFEVGKDYIVKNISLCDDCVFDEKSCTILGLMERGLVPGSNLNLISDTLGLYQLNVDGTIIAIRKSEGWKFHIDVE